MSMCHPLEFDEVVGAIQKEAEMVAPQAWQPLELALFSMQPDMASL